MTLKEALGMNAAQFKDACNKTWMEAEPLDAINDNAETLQQSAESFSKFTSTPDSVKKIHEVGRMVP
jgi:hypothetical protein